MEADQTMVIASLLLGGLLVFFLYLCSVVLMKPQRLASRLEKQGIRGPSPSSFLLGNIPEMKRIQHQVQTQSASNLPITHDWPSTLFPYFYQWFNQYGSTFMYSSGNIQFLCTTDVDIVKGVSLCTSFRLGKPSYLSKDRGPLMGQSILSTSGRFWIHQRKIIGPELYIDKVKNMVSLMVDSTSSMMKSLESRIESAGGAADINIEPDLRSLAADIISRACFGSNYAKGEEIFLKLTTLKNVMSKGFIGIPGSRYLPTKRNREIWRLEKELNSMILRVVRQRAATNSEKDLLQMILEGARGDHKNLPSNASLDKFVVDNCKAIYFAGQETTAITASWCLMLLASHPDWQARVRTEVQEICKDNLPDANMLLNMKTLTMVIQETLRLYPPAPFVVRKASEDIKFKDIIIPKGMNIQIPIPILQQNPNLWGPDAHQFNPERFANGIIGATTSPQAYLPFGVGPHICAGQHFAMTELKVILSLILSKFSFSLSPAYRHSPAQRLVVQPEHGVTLHVSKV